MTKSGYKYPPKEHQFKKGTSGNPKGRPPKSKQVNDDPVMTIAQHLSRELEGSIEVNENGNLVRITKGEAVAKRMCAQALAGKTSQQKMVLSLEALRQRGSDTLQSLEEQQVYDEELIAELYTFAQNIDAELDDEFE